MEELKRILRKYPQQVLMLVGHEPDFSDVIAAVTGGDVKISKAGVALVDMDGKKGKLLWLFPPKSGEEMNRVASKLVRARLGDYHKLPDAGCPRLRRL